MRRLPLFSFFAAIDRITPQAAPVTALRQFAELEREPGFDRASDFKNCAHVVAFLSSCAKPGERVFLGSNLQTLIVRNGGKPASAHM